MMNKKGISIFKTILFIILSVIFCVLVVYVINYINTKNKKDSRSIIKMVEPTNYNPVDDIYSYYIMAYKNSNFTINDSYSTNVFNYESNNLVYYYVDGYYNYNNVPNTYIQGILNSSSSYYPYGFNVNTSDNKLLIGRDLYSAHNTQYQWTSWNSVRSWAICYNCDISISAFNFTMYYNFPINSSFSLYFYIYTDVGSIRFTNFNFSSSSLNYSFAGSSILSSLPNATKVLRFGFGFAQSTSTTNSVHYLPNSAGSSSSTNGINYDSNQVYTNYFNTLTDVQKDNCVYFAFNTASYPIDYVNGYNEGFNDALNNSNQQINSLNTTISNQLEQINNLNSTITSMQTQIDSLQEQLNLQNENFKGLFFTLADVPFKTVANVLGFEVFGVNLFNFFIGLITALGLIWLVKKFV